MNKLENYVEHPNKAVETDERFKHVMAITLNPRSRYKDGIIRCITSREGNLQIKGYMDRSKLYRIKEKSLEKFEITNPLIIKNESEIIGTLTKNNGDCIGLEDPDIWIDKKTDLMHIYFTIPIKFVDKEKRTKIHLGHAVGKSLDSLIMTEPILLANDKFSAQEVSIAPLNKQGIRYNLIESRDHRSDWTYSTVQVAIAEDMGKPWKYGKVAFHPADHNISWIAGHASPGPLLPNTFIDVGKSKLLGILNGREANKNIGGQVKY
ncbi:MAG: hypothetical protein AAB795_00250, partial [Patescibacteria group bacterium]